MSFATGIHLKINPQCTKLYDWVCVFFPVYFKQGYHDVIWQLIWKSLKAVFQGFIVTWHLHPAKAWIYNDAIRPAAIQIHVCLFFIWSHSSPLKPLLSKSVCLAYFGMLKRTMGSKWQLWSNEEEPISPSGGEGGLGVTQVASRCRCYSFVSICCWTIETSEKTINWEKAANTSLWCQKGHRNMYSYSKSLNKSFTISLCVLRSPTFPVKVTTPVSTK